MSALLEIAHFQNRRDEVPNQELAKKLAGAGNEAGIRELIENLGRRNCILSDRKQDESVRYSLGSREIGW